MSTRAIDPSILKFAQSLVRVKARQLARAIPSASVNGQDDLEQSLLLEVVVRWPGFNPQRGHAEAFIENVVRTKVCKLLRDAKRAKRSAGTQVSIDDNDAPDPLDAIRQTCVRVDVRDVIGSLPARDRRVCDQLLRETVSEAARQLRTPRSTLESAVNRLRDCFEKSEINEYLS